MLLCSERVPSSAGSITTDSDAAYMGYSLTLIGVLCTTEHYVNAQRVHNELIKFVIGSHWKKFSWVNNSLPKFLQLLLSNRNRNQTKIQKIKRSKRHIALLLSFYTSYNMCRTHTFFLFAFFLLLFCVRVNPYSLRSNQSFTAHYMLHDNRVDCEDHLLGAKRIRYSCENRL